MLSEITRAIRIKKELEDLERCKKQKKIPSNLKVEHIVKNGEISDYNLKITISGRPGTIWENYKKIEGVLIFPKNYPIEPPQFRFNEDFKHIHVYEGGNICLPLISADRWDFKTSLVNILVQIEDLIHRAPNLSSPANSQLGSIYLNNPNYYKEFIQQQSSRMKTL